MALTTAHVQIYPTPYTPHSYTVAVTVGPEEAPLFARTQAEWEDFTATGDVDLWEQIVERLKIFGWQLSDWRESDRTDVCAYTAKATPCTPTDLTLPAYR